MTLSMKAILIAGLFMILVSDSSCYAKPVAEKTPQGTVKSLIEDPDKSFIGLRHYLSDDDIRHFDLCFTPELLRHCRLTLQAIDTWLDDPKNEGEKLPVGGGSVFYKHYENADTCKIIGTKIEGEIAYVSISYTYTEDSTTVAWTDRVMLRRRKEIWLVDDIFFDGGGTFKAGYKLVD